MRERHMDCSSRNRSDPSRSGRSRPPKSLSVILYIWLIVPIFSTLQSANLPRVHMVPPLFSLMSSALFLDFLLFIYTYIICARIISLYFSYRMRMEDFFISSLFVNWIIKKKFSCELWRVLWAKLSAVCMCPDVAVFLFLGKAHPHLTLHKVLGLFYWI